MSLRESDRRSGLIPADAGRLAPPPGSATSSNAKVVSVLLRLSSPRRSLFWDWMVRSFVYPTLMEALLLFVVFVSSSSCLVLFLFLLLLLLLLLVVFFSNMICCFCFLSLLNSRLTELLSHVIQFK